MLKVDLPSFLLSWVQNEMFIKFFLILNLFTHEEKS